MKKFVRNEEGRQAVVKELVDSKLPFYINVEVGKKRSNEQNNLQRLWLSELAKKGDMTAEEYRAYCKLHFGVPILREESELFREKYDRLFKNRYSYEEKLEMMAVPVDFPVTRLMTVKQKKKYLDKIYIHFSSKGFALTNPNDYLEL